MSSQYRSLLAAGAAVLAVGASGGRTETRLLATLGPYEFGDVAPSADGKFVLVGVDSALLKVDVASRALSTVARGNFFNVAISPNGNRIAFQRFTNTVPGVWSARFDASRGVIDSIMRLADSARVPVFSPDGSRIALTRRFGKTDSLAVVSVTGERVAVPATGGVNLLAAGWSRDGRAIYYTAVLGGSNNRAVYKVDLSGGVTRTLIERNFEGRVRVSPDERHLLYRRNSAMYSVATVNGEHIADIDIEQLGFGREIGNPQWLPGTSNLVFSSLRVPRVLVGHSLDGGTSRALSDSTSFITSAAVSPNGGFLAAIAAGPGNARVMIRSMSGGDARHVDVGAPIAEIGPNAFLLWSPDGRYVAVPTGNTDGLVSHVNPAGFAVVDARSGAARRLATAQLIPSASVSRYAWSPDSRAIRYVLGYDSAAGPHRPLEIREATLDGRDGTVRELSQCCGGATFADFDHTYTKADGLLTDLRTGTTQRVMDPALLPVPEPGNVIPMACFTQDSKYAALNWSASGRGPYNRVMIVSIGTGERRLVDAGLSRTTANSIFCHPDGKQIIVSGLDSAGVSRAVSISTDGLSRRVIGEVDRDVPGMFLMSISPDGKWLLTSRTLPAKPLELVTVAAVPASSR